MLYAEKIGRDLVGIPLPYTLRVYGLVISWVAPGWQGPIRLILHRDGRPALCIWAGEALVDAYHAVGFPLFPHGGQKLSVLGGTITVIGEQGVCGCCVAGSWSAHGLMRAMSSASHRAASTTPPLVSTVPNSEESSSVTEDWDLPGSGPETADRREP